MSHNLFIKSLGVLKIWTTYLHNILCVFIIVAYYKFTFFVYCEIDR